MTPPEITLRRHPRIAILLLALGLIAVGLGLLFSEFWVVFLGVLPVIFAALLMLSPFVVVTNGEVELRNVFGQVGARYAHDGFHLLTIEGDCLYIRKGDRRAAVKPIVRSHVHAGDWTILTQAIQSAHMHHHQKGKSNSHT